MVETILASICLLTEDKKSIDSHKSKYLKQSNKWIKQDKGNKKGQDYGKLRASDLEKYSFHGHILIQI